MASRPAVSIRYPIRPNPDAWVIPEGPVPESTAHDACVLRIVLLLTAWASARPGVRVARNLALRWLPEHPRTGIDPDVCVLSPAPEDFDDLASLKLWEPSRQAPPFCVEVVSASHPYKDYGDVHERYAALGCYELLVCDPQHVGPRSLGGPVALQLWRRDAGGIFDRVHFGDEPVYSHFLEAWILVENRTVFIAADRAGNGRWQTAEEQNEELRVRYERELAEKERERAEKERERAEKEYELAEKVRERAAREDVERRLRELEAKLAAR